MKILGIIFAALMLLGSALASAAGSSKSIDLGAEIGAASSVLSEAQMEAAGLPSPGRLKGGGIVGIAAALGAFVLVLIVFFRREKVLLVAVATMGLCVLAILIYPTIDIGPNEGLAPRTQAIVAMALAGLGTGGALLAKGAGENG